MNQESLIIKIETLQNQLKQREEDCENYLKRNTELERVALESQNIPVELRSFEIDTLSYLQSQLRNMINLQRDLQDRYIGIKSHKHSYKKLYKMLRETQKASAPRTLSEVEADNQNLRKQVIELNEDINKYKKDFIEEEKRADIFQKKFDFCSQELENFQRNAVEKFDILKAKIYEAREGKPDPEIVASLKKENEYLKAENESFKSTIDKYEDATQQMTSSQTEFVGLLENYLGCRSLPEIVESVKKLSLLKTENEKLKIEISNLQILGTVDQNDAYASVIDSLRQVKENISPDELNLTFNSPLRQLFAALSNAINAIMAPNASKVVLLPHIRSVVHQARAFKAEDLISTNGNSSSADSSPKELKFDVEMGNIFSPINSKYGSKHIPSNIVFSSGKSSD